MLNYYYSDKISDFLLKPKETIIGEISLNGRLGHIHTELFAWEEQISILKKSLINHSGHLFFEFSIPRMGKRVDCVLIIKNIVFIIEFKVGEKNHLNVDIEQVWDYALDLKNFHKPSHNLTLVPILVATEAKSNFFQIIIPSQDDKLINPLKANSKNLGLYIDEVFKYFNNNEIIDPIEYLNGSYTPTPKIGRAHV
ncbi:MAG TPA: hypothetical protein DIS94_09390, partial [Bacteroidetes bacterium]|nr:hypothetical protein [Bacteroidota bacterium]